jgi:hypothetical protein
MRQFWTYDVTSMTQILKCFNEYNSRSFNCLNEEIAPVALSSFKEN